MTANGNLASGTLATKPTRPDADVPVGAIITDDGLLWQIHLHLDPNRSDGLLEQVNGRMVLNQLAVPVLTIHDVLASEQIVLLRIDDMGNGSGVTLRRFVKVKSGWKFEE